MHVSRSRKILLSKESNHCACLCKIYLLTFTVACHIVKPHKIAHLMYNTAMNDVKMKERPESSNWAALDRIGETMVLKLLISVGSSVFN